MIIDLIVLDENNKNIKEQSIIPLKPCKQSALQIITSTLKQISLADKTLIIKITSDKTIKNNNYKRLKVKQELG